MNNQPNNFNPEEYMNNLEMERTQLQQKNLELSGALTSSNFQEHEEQNLIYKQLETDKILERCEHFLKGDQIKFNKRGAYFAEPTKNVLAIVKKDIRTKIVYYIQEVKEAKKGSEVLKEVLVKIKNKDKHETTVLEEDSRIILNKLKNIKL